MTKSLHAASGLECVNRGSCDWQSVLKRAGTVLTKLKPLGVG
ncbi:MAG: hypothetical protein ACKN85_06240 [Pirellula sp.]